MSSCYHLFMVNFPKTRLRRLRHSLFSRNLVQENRLHIHDLIYPLFVVGGKGEPQTIESMPNIFRWPENKILTEIEEVCNLGIQAIILFPVVPDSEKSLLAEQCYDENGLVQRILRLIKHNFPELGIITDIALDPFTTHGHDGVLNTRGEVDNDATVKILIKQALSHAAAGADIVAPSDMMDGRIGLIRDALEKNNFINTQILAYSAKYHSSYYAPFRNALNSGQNLGKQQKKQYQMNIANRNEAFREVSLDLQEGADMILIKPGMPYLDVIYAVKQKFKVPTLVYQVSGEYSMHMAAIQAGWLGQDVMMEGLLCFKRAGADAIVSYFSKYAAKILSSY